MSKSVRQASKQKSVGRGLPLPAISRWLNSRCQCIPLSDEQRQPVNGWVEVKLSERPLEQPELPIEVNIGLYVVRVRQGFDRSAFADICRTLRELC